MPVLFGSTAKKLWCPLACTYFEAAGAMVSVNRDDNGDPRKECCCITDKCMSWRWAIPPTTKRDGAGYCLLIDPSSEYEDLDDDLTEKDDSLGG